MKILAFILIALIGLYYLSYLSQQYADDLRQYCIDNQNEVLSFKDTKSCERVME